MNKKPFGDVTVAELAMGSESFREVAAGFLQTVVSVKGQDGWKLADHLLRRLFTDGDTFQYDPGDEPAMEISR